MTANKADDSDSTWHQMVASMRKRHCFSTGWYGYRKLPGARHEFASGTAGWPWNNGQTEGQINRLKTLKRQLYERANLDFLRQRVLHAA